MRSVFTPQRGLSPLLVVLLLAAGCIPGEEGSSGEGGLNFLLGPPLYQLDVAVDGEGSVDPAEGAFVADDTVTLTATPDDGSVFVQWTGDVPAESAEQNPLAVTMDGDRVLTAVFQRQYTLAVTIDGQGTVDPSEGVYDAGASVSLTPAPAEGWDFVRWEGDLLPEAADENSHTVVLDANLELTAVFERGIIPGQAAGPIALGDSFGDVLDTLGPPSDVYPSIFVWVVYVVYDELGITGVLTDTDFDEDADVFEPVEMIILRAPFSGTYQGVTIGSTPDEVIEVMGPPEETLGDEYWYWKRGITWTVEYGFVTKLAVFEPLNGGSAKSHNGISSEERRDDLRKILGSPPG